MCIKVCPCQSSGAALHQVGGLPGAQAERFHSVQDPKEATRERIERLKKDGAVELEEPSSDKGAIPPAKVPVLKQGRAAASEVSRFSPMHASSTQINTLERCWPPAAWAQWLMRHKDCLCNLLDPCLIVCLGIIQQTSSTQDMVFLQGWLAGFWQCRQRLRSSRAPRSCQSSR